MKSNLQTPEHIRTRNFFRVAGVLTVVVGLVFIIVAFVDFVRVVNSPSFDVQLAGPKLFWCFFVGGPLLFFGIVMCNLGFAGAIARYMTAEGVPVATDAANDLAEGTQGAVKTVAHAIAEGVREAHQDKPNKTS